MTETSTKTYQELEQDLEDVKETLDITIDKIYGDQEVAEMNLKRLLERIK